MAKWTQEVSKNLNYKHILFQEDDELIELVEQHHGNWDSIGQLFMQDPQGFSDRGVHACEIRW